MTVFVTAFFLMDVIPYLAISVQNIYRLDLDADDDPGRSRDEVVPQGLRHERERPKNVINVVVVRTIFF